jgi:hypothetical protein
VLAPAQAAGRGFPDCYSGAGGRSRLPGSWFQCEEPVGPPRVLAGRANQVSFRRERSVGPPRSWSGAGSRSGCAGRGFHRRQTVRPPRSWSGAGSRSGHLGRGWGRGHSGQRVVGLDVGRRRSWMWPPRVGNWLRCCGQLLRPGGRGGRMPPDALWRLTPGWGSRRRKVGRQAGAAAAARRPHRWQAAGCMLLSLGMPPPAAASRMQPLPRANPPSLAASWCSRCRLRSAAWMPGGSPGVRAFSSRRRRRNSLRLRRRPMGVRRRPGPSRRLWTGVSLCRRGPGGTWRGRRIRPSAGSARRCRRRRGSENHSAAWRQGMARL